MVVIQGMYEITEVVAASIGCVGFFICGFNIVSLTDAPDLSTVLFILSVVLLVNHVRVRLLAPVQELWRFVLELVFFYLCTQATLLYVWEQFHFLLYVVRDSVMSTRPVLNLLVDNPKLFTFLRQDSWYFLQLLIAIGITYKTVVFTKALDYALPGRRQYQYCEGLATDEIFDNFWKRPRLLSRHRRGLLDKPMSIHEELDTTFVENEESEVD